LQIKLEEKGKLKISLQKKLEDKSEKFSELQSERNIKQSRYFELKEKRDSLRENRNQLNEKLIIYRNEMRDEEHRCSNFSITDEGLRVKQEDLFTRMHSEFHLDIEEHYYQRSKSLDPLFNKKDQFKELSQDFQLNIRETEDKIKNLGNVNFEAVEELEQLEEREEELKEQLDDLSGSFKKLDLFIKETDRKCSEMFMESFTIINGHFEIMFSKLFGGGKGKLLLEEDLDPLEAGISISASPPGKSPKVLSQLSGGEKVLTTIAFLFSIFLYKPSPFCILDEVDAPLDEHNVDRFMEAIRSFTDRCQFLIVTHNRRTMSLSDVIHGVTMQENGVSRCVSVDIESLEFNDIANQAST